jgi:diacylglycerol kinase
MAKKKSLSPAEILKSFGHAWDGLRDIIKTEHTAWIHSVMTILVIFMCWWLRVNFLEFSLIVLAVVSVWVAESFNTVFEILTDHVSPDYSETAKRAKDIAAAAVLITCIGSSILGLFILGPPLYRRLLGH